MMEWYVLAGLSIGMGISFLLLYTRRKMWNTAPFRWGLTVALFVIGLLGIGQSGLAGGKSEFPMYWGMMTPLIYNGFDRLLKRISEYYQKRDFYLYLRHSSDIREFPLDNPHVTTMDIVISFGLLIVIVLTPLLPFLT